MAWWELTLTIAGIIFAGTAAAWGGISIFSWVTRPRFAINFLGDGFEKTVVPGQKVAVEMEFTNRRACPATAIRAYVVFPNQLGGRVTSTGTNTAPCRTTTPGGRFDQCPVISNTEPVVLFREESTTLEVEVDVPKDAVAKSELHAMIVCAERTSKTRRLFLTTA